MTSDIVEEGASFSTTLEKVEELEVEIVKKKRMGQREKV